jgi:hypothetical protein
LIGSCATVRGHVIGSLPVYGLRTKSVSLTPLPSLLGNQAATSASVAVRCAGSICSGRPDTTITVHERAAAQTLSTAALSASLSIIVCGGRSPVSPGSKPHCGPPTSPKPSAYGVSPTTTTPSALCGTGADAVSLNVTSPREADRIPSRIVSPGIWWFELPCHVIVQPPAWLPMLSALLPAT